MAHCSISIEAMHSVEARDNVEHYHDGTPWMCGVTGNRNRLKIDTIMSPNPITSTLRLWCNGRHNCFKNNKTAGSIPARRTLGGGLRECGL